MFADKLRDLRTAKGLTQEELGEAVGVKALQIWRWETGEFKPQLEQLKRLAEYFHVSADFLLDLSDDPTPIRLTESWSELEREVMAAMRAGDNVKALKILAKELA